MKHIKFLGIIILGLLVVCLAWWLEFRYFPAQEGSSLSESQIKSNITSIARRYTNMYADYAIWDASDKLRFGENAPPVLAKMTTNQRAISITGGESPAQNMTPQEVYALFEMHLFLADKALPYEIVSISWDYKTIAWSGAQGQVTRITKPEFETLYHTTVLVGLSNEQAAKILADKWIEQTLYFKGCNRDEYEQNRLSGKSNREKLMLILRDNYYVVEGSYYGKTFVNNVITLLELNKVEHFLTSDETGLLEPFYEVLIEQQRYDSIAREQYGDTYDRYSGSEVREYNNIKTEILDTLFHGKSLLESAELMRGNNN
jgi:hypothetical protein